MKVLALALTVFATLAATAPAVVDNSLTARDETSPASEHACPARCVAARCYIGGRHECKCSTDQLAAIEAGTLNVRDLHQQFEFPSTSTNETVRVKQIDKSKIPPPILTGKWRLADKSSKGPPVDICPRMCLQQSPPNTRPVFWMCNGECAGQAAEVAATVDDTYYAEIEPTEPQSDITTADTQDGRCDSRCEKYRCCSSSRKYCNCKPHELDAIEAGTLSVQDVLAARSADVSPILAPIVKKRDGCDSLCQKYHCCQSDDTCTCSPAQLSAIASGTLTVEEVLAAQDIAISPFTEPILTV